MKKRLVFLLAIGAVAGCKSSTMPIEPTVAFTYDAPFCGRALVEKSIDGIVVAVDSMASGTTSKVFPVPAGDHVLGARTLRITNGQTVPNYQWPDTTVSLRNDSPTVTRVLSLYCS